MALANSPFVLRDTSLILKKVGDANGTDYRCQLTAATLTPSAGGTAGGATLSTFCADHSDASSTATTWTLDLTGFQSYADAQDFSMWAFDNEDAKAEFTLVPGQDGGVPTATNPGFTGTVTVRPTVIGGTAKQFATFTVSLPLDTRPTKITTAAVF